MGTGPPSIAKGQVPSESTPLIPKDAQVQSRACFTPLHRVLLCGFLVSMSFGVTQVPLVYVFRLMTCESYYERHQEPPAGRDRCSVPIIEADTAKSIALLGASTTVFGVANLFITGWAIKRFGVKITLATQVLWPAARLLVQSIGVTVGSGPGIIIVQCSQIVTIIGGPNGYMLALNSYVTEVAEPKHRTSALGRLQGCTMLGGAVGLLLGGILADVFEMVTPFHVTFGLFLTSTIYVLLFLPWIAPQPKSEVAKKRSTGYARFFGPIKTIMPSKWVTREGRVQWEYGAIVLAAGSFLGVLATGYIPTLLQLYATDIFGFGTRRNSMLVALHTFLRGLFLMFAFPRIISAGRRWLENAEDAKRQLPKSVPTSGSDTPDEQVQIAEAMQDEEDQDVKPPKLADDQQTYEFDLIYTRFSLLVDGALTLGAAFVKEGWQMYLVAIVLPFGAGTASAAKGTILQMCPSSERTDALSAIAFVEMLARLSTTFVFGLVFAAFANIQKTWLVFICNGAIALLGFLILFLSRFPPEGSRRLELKQVDDDSESDGS